MPTIVYSATWDVDTESPDTAFNMTRVTSPVHDGAGAARLLSPNDVAYWVKNLVGGSQTTVVMSIWMRIDDLPAADMDTLFGVWVTGEGFYGLAWDSATGQLFSNIQAAPSGTPAGPVIQEGVWYALNVTIDVSGGTTSVEGMIDGVTIPEVTDTGGPFAAADIRLGDFATTLTFDVFFDTLNVSYTLADYPLLLITEGGRRIYKRLYGPAHLATSATTLYTAPDGVKTTIRRIWANNPSGSPVDFTFSIGADAAGTRLYSSEDIPATGEVEETRDHTLEPGEVIQASAGSGSTVVLVVDGYEESI